MNLQIKTGRNRGLTAENAFFRIILLILNQRKVGEAFSTEI